MVKGRNSKVIGIRIPDKVVEDLTKIAERNRVTLSALIRQCLEDKFAVGLTGKRLHSGQQGVKDLETRVSKLEEQLARYVPAGKSVTIRHDSGIEHEAQQVFLVTD